ncbi:hypothetical protein RCL1_002237 [Eukaryota sp. TZLM3-RCL]
MAGWGRPSPSPPRDSEEVVNDVTPSEVVSSSIPLSVFPEDVDAPTPCNVLALFGLNPGTTQELVSKTFTDLGSTPTKIVIPRDRDTNRIKGFAFVDFVDVETATQLLEKVTSQPFTVGDFPEIVRVDFSKTTKPHDPTPGSYKGKRVGRPYRDDRSFGRDFPRRDRYSNDRDSFAPHRSSSRLEPFEPYPSRSSDRYRDDYSRDRDYDSRSRHSSRDDHVSSRYSPPPRDRYEPPRDRYDSSRDRYEPPRERYDPSRDFSRRHDDRDRFDRPSSRDRY